MSAPRDGLEDLFREPPGDFFPVPLWWWSGEPVEAGRLRWQLDRLAEGSVRNVVVINLAPAGPSFGCPADEPLWFSERWWELFRVACDGARARGMRVWFYDQLGFSGANLQGRLVTTHPDAAGETIERVTADVGVGVAGDTSVACELSAPAGTRPVAAAALPLDRDGAVAGPPVPLDLDLDGSTVRFAGFDDGRPGRPARVLLAYARRAGFDYLCPEACRLLVDAVHGELERRVPDLLGDVVAGSFQDELPALGTWTPRFLDAFRDQHGYELGPVVAALWEDWGPPSARVRVAYHATRAALAEAALFRPLAEWHQRHGMLQGCDQQSPARQGHPIGATQLYGDYTRTHRWFSVPGCDHYGDAKLHSSLAHLHGGERAWLEGFHSSGWGATLEEIFDWLLPGIQAGVTLYNPHAVYYSTVGGWFEWAPPSTCWRQPYWRHYEIFARTVARLCAVLAQGVHRCDVAVLYPATTVQAHLPVDRAVAVDLPGVDTPTTVRTPADEAQEAYLDLVGRMSWLDMRPGVLHRDRRDFDVLDEAALAGAEVVGATLVVRGEVYRAVVLPAVRALTAGAATVLVRFAGAGGRVVLAGAHPEIVVDPASAPGAATDIAATAHAAGAAGAAGSGGAAEAAGAARAARAAKVAEAAGDELAAELAAHPGVRRVAHAGDVPAALAPLERVVDAPVPTLLRRVGRRHVLFVPAAYPRATGAVATRGPHVADYDFDASRYARASTVRVRDVPGTPSLWDPVTGTISPVTVRELAGGVREIDVTFDHGPAALVVFDPAPPDDTAMPDDPAPPGGTAMPDEPARSRSPVGGRLRRTPSVAARRSSSDAATIATPAPPAATGGQAAGRDGTGPPAAGPGPPGSLVLDGPWVSELVPTMDNRHGDVARPAHPGSPPLGVWSMRHRSDPDDRGLAGGWSNGRWPDGSADGPAEVRPTFGPHALVTGPVPLDRLPPPLAGIGGLGGLGEARGGTAPGWQPVTYSDSRGIERDPLHLGRLGPKGAVPDDFLLLPMPPAGAGVQLRTVVRAERAGPAHLAIAAPVRKTAWWNGEPLPPDPGGRLLLAPVDVRDGPNLLELRLEGSAATRQATLRAHWALVSDPDAYCRPEWLAAAGTPQRGTAVVARGELDLTRPARAARLLAATGGVGAVTVNGREVVRFGEQGWYASLGQPPVAYVADVGRLLRPGRNVVEVSVRDDGVASPVLVDVDLGDGRTWSTSAGWSMTREGAQVPVDLVRGVSPDPGSWCARPRAHPLAATAWLDGGAAARPAGHLPGNVVIPATGSPDAAATSVEWFRFELPPGATRVSLPVHGEAEAWVDGKPAIVVDGGFELEPGGGTRTCTVRVLSAGGARGGAVWRQPPVVEVGTGRIAPGDWREQGLGAWSGGVAYRRPVELTASQAAGSVTLDLGAVRGTVEVLAGGRTVGRRVLSPWTFDLTGHVGAGVNDLEVRVFGTLGPHLFATSPTRGVLPAQLRTGLLGPVRLLFNSQI